MNQSAIVFCREIQLICHRSEIVTNDKLELPVFSELLIDQDICMKQVLAFTNYQIKSGTY